MLPTDPSDPKKSSATWIVGSLVLSVGLRNLCSLTARQFGLKVADLKSPSRQRAVVLARGVAMYLARQTSGKTLVQIGRFFGGRDHSTVLHGCRQVERLLHCDAETRVAVEALQAELAKPWHRPLGDLPDAP